MTEVSGKSARVLVVAGESSADRYGAELVRCLRALPGNEGLRFFGTGGDAMQAAGVELLRHVRDLGHIGPKEALTGLRTYLKTFTLLLEAAAAERPRVAVLIDFPEFNLRLAKKMKRLEIPVVYYIGPHLWAWRKGRIRTIRRCVDRMLVILPFEEAYYRERGVEAEFVGHPLLESAPGPDPVLPSATGGPECRTVAILPGSRRREVDHILPTLLLAGCELMKRTPARFLVSVAPTVDAGQVEGILERTLRGREGRRHFHVLTGSSRAILAAADFAFVKSGTSTLEAALAGVPFLITYKISRVSWWVGSLLIRSSTKGLVNLIAGERIVPELFQGEATPEALAQVALHYLENPAESAAMRARLGLVRRQLGAHRASERAAAVVNGYL
jgi:lipid-A-disaccharide synthase